MVLERRSTEHRWQRATEASEHRRTRRRKRRRSWQPRFPVAPARWQWIVAAAAVVLLVLGLWGYLDLRSVRRELLAARTDLAGATANLGAAADGDASRQVRDATDRAVTRTADAWRRTNRSVPLRLAGAVPGLRAQRAGLLGAVGAAHQAALVGERLAADLAALDDRLTVRNGTVDLAALGSLAEATSHAAATLRTLPKANNRNQWPPLFNTTAKLDQIVADTAQRLDNSAGVMRVGVNLLGGDRIFIAMLNNAEMRDQGMVLSYAVAETNGGSFHVTRSGSVEDLALKTAITDVALPAGTKQIFGALDPTRIWQSVNATADTSLSGATIRSMYRAATGQTIDGVLALDVPALSALLSVTGPVRVNGIGIPITAENAADVLLNDLYAAAPISITKDTAREERQELLGATVTAVLERVRSASVNGAALIKALGDAARGGHVWVSSANRDDEAALVRAGLAGSPARVGAERTFHLAVQNGTATKLDWFVDPEVDVDITLADDGTAVVNTTVVVPNRAPIPSPPSEQLGPDNIVNSIPGLYRGRVYLWGPSIGDQLDSVAESGLRLNFKTTDVRAGQKQTVKFQTVLERVVRDGELRLRFVPQPRVRPMRLRLRVHGEGWSVQSEVPESFAWDRTLDLVWKTSRG